MYRSTRTLRRRLLAYGCLVLLAGVTATTALAQASQTEERAAAQTQGLVSKMWWNQPQKVEELGLNEAQRSRMDAHLLTFLGHRGEGIKQQREALKKLADALGRGDTAAARASRDEIAAATSAPVQRQIDMMIAVTAELTAEQRGKLRETYPNLLSRMWVRSGNLRGAGGRGAGARGGAASRSSG